MLDLKIYVYPFHALVIISSSFYLNILFFNSLYFSMCKHLYIDIKVPIGLLYILTLKYP